MERLLRHYVPDIDLSTEGLYTKVQSLSPEDKDTDQPAAASPESDSDGNGAIHDEDCTINAVNDDVARELTRSKSQNPH